MSIAEKLLAIYNGVEDVRDALQEIDSNLGKGAIGTLGDDVRTISASPNGYGVTVYGDVRSSEEVEVTAPDTQETTTETQYSYSREIILDSTLIADNEHLSTDVIDGLGELDGDMVDLANGKVQIPLNTGVKITVDPTKTLVKFRDPIVENIVLTNWGTEGKITLSQVRAITTLGTYFKNTAIETFDEFKWFDGITESGINATFLNCTSLTSIKLPRVTKIDQKAFRGCTSLAQIVIPDTFTELGHQYTYQEGFFQNTAIEELEIPDSVTKASTDVFRQMTSLKKLKWGNNLPFPCVIYNATGGNNFLYGCSNLESIENFPSTFATDASGNKFFGGFFNGLEKLVFTPNMLSVIQEVNGCISNARPFENTKIFDYAPNATLTFPNITTNKRFADQTWSYAFTSSSEGGCVLQLLNWVENPYIMYASRIGKVVFSENLSTIKRFAQGSNIPEFILPCTTPPTLNYAGDPTGGAYSRIYVPEASLSDYLSAENWSLVANKIRAYKDPSTAAATFCAIPAAAPVPTNYTKVNYISNISGDTAKNCQISNIGYTPKQYTQFLFDFAHKHVATTANSSCLLYMSGRNNQDFNLVIDSTADDREPRIIRNTSTNANYPNPMGITLAQAWYFNSHITGESFGKRSILKYNYHWIEYHGLAHQVDPATGDAGAAWALFRFNNNTGMTTRQVKIYRFCIFEPIAGFTDADDPTQYEIVRDYIPAMRNSDGVYGLYERLTDTFYPSTIAAAPFSGPDYEE